MSIKSLVDRMMQARMTFSMLSWLPTDESLKSELVARDASVFADAFDLVNLVLRRILLSTESVIAKARIR